MDSFNPEVVADTESIFSDATTLKPDPDINDEEPRTEGSTRARKTVLVTLIEEFAFTGHNNDTAGRKDAFEVSLSLLEPVHRHFTSYRGRKNADDPCPQCTGSKQVCSLRDDLSICWEKYSTDRDAARKEAILGWCMKRSGMQRESRMPFTAPHEPEPWVGSGVTIVREKVLPGPYKSRYLCYE